jgi:hypothetical protein
LIGWYIPLLLHYVWNILFSDEFQQGDQVESFTPLRRECGFTAYPHGLLRWEKYAMIIPPEIVHQLMPLKAVPPIFFMFLPCFFNELFM